MSEALPVTTLGEAESPEVARSIHAYTTQMVDLFNAAPDVIKFRLLCSVVVTATCSQDDPAGHFGYLVHECMAHIRLHTVRPEGQA